MAVTASRHRFPETIAFLTFLCFLALLTPQGDAAVPTESGDDRMSLSAKVVINDNDTYDMTITVKITSKTSYAKKNVKNRCDPSNLMDSFEDMKASYTEQNGVPTCILSAKSRSISKVEGFIEHEGDEYILDSKKGGLPTPSEYDGEYKLSVTFPGKVTDADGGKVSGNTVTFTEPGNYRVKGKDTPAFPWVWVIMGVVLVGAIGGGVFWFLNNRKKQSQQQAYMVSTAGYGLQQPYAPGQLQAPGAVPPPPSDFVAQGGNQPGLSGVMPPGAVPPPPGYPSAPSSPGVEL